VQAIDDLAPGMPAPLKGMMASALAQGSDEQIREKIAQVIERLAWAINEAPVDEAASDES
jgi:hypothetical protein